MEKSGKKEARQEKTKKAAENGELVKKRKIPVEEGDKPTVPKVNNKKVKKVKPEPKDVKGLLQKTIQG